MYVCGLVCQELQPVVGDLRYAALHSMMLTVTKNPQNVQKALKNFHEILNVDVRICCMWSFAFSEKLEVVFEYVASLKCVKWD